ncbi:Kinesin-like protein [Vigna angularis]|uniref:Kinesin-like protein n=1 Tax=Phaseolus angularis TaxID=3914 RepID=A0A8T0KC40_PHAAN|nr:Kinesin-like protein [Vigna angularis]
MYPSPNPNCAANKEPPPEHPIEVVARIHDYPDRKDKPLFVLQTSSNSSFIRVQADFGYRDFTLDGVSVSEEEDLDVFYKKFVESRINGVKLGDKCTIMMYGPTTFGKSHTGVSSQTARSGDKLTRDLRPADSSSSGHNKFDKDKGVNVSLGEDEARLNMPIVISFNEDFTNSSSCMVVVWARMVAGMANDD